MVTNTTASFYGFSYGCGDLEWSGQGFETAIVGYNSHADYFFNHPANGVADIGQIVSCTRQVIPTGGRRKRAAGVTGLDEPANGAMPCNPDVTANAERCNGLAVLDQQSITDAENLMDFQGSSIFQVLPPCPPTRALVELSTKFVNLADDMRDCYQSTMMFEPFIQGGFRPYQFVSVCCYDQNR